MNALNIPMVPVALGKDKREEEVKYDLSIVDGVPGDVGHEPVPKLRQCPAQKKWSDRSMEVKPPAPLEYYDGQTD